MGKLDCGCNWTGDKWETICLLHMIPMDLRAKVQALELQIEELTKQRDQWKNSSCYKKAPCGHCNCYQDIDYDFPGCSWCAVTKDNKECNEGWVEDREKLATANRLNDELKKCLRQAVDTVLAKSWGNAHDTEWMMTALSLFADKRNDATKTCKVSWPGTKMDDSDRTYCGRPLPCSSHNTK